MLPHEQVRIEVKDTAKGGQRRIELALHVTLVVLVLTSERSCLSEAWGKDCFKFCVVTQSVSVSKTAFYGFVNHWKNHLGIHLIMSSQLADFATQNRFQVFIRESASIMNDYAKLCNSRKAHRGQQTMQGTYDWDHYMYYDNMLLKQNQVARSMT